MRRFLLLSILALVLPFTAFAQQPTPPRDDYRDPNLFRRTGPLTPAERNAPWPSRDRPAETFRDAFCRIWDDGCTRCERDESRWVTCAPMSREGTCERKPIVCDETLPTIARVCLVYHDGCNHSDLGSGAATAVLCRHEGRSPPPRTGSTCTIPRRSSYESDQSTRDDLAGFWWLVAPDGETCVVVLNSTSGMTLASPCSPRLRSRLRVDPGSYESAQAPETVSCSYAVERRRLAITCPADHTPWQKKRLFRLGFSLRDLDHPVGIGRSGGWRLLRISTLF